MTNIHIAELRRLLKENQNWAVTTGVLHLVVTLTQLEGTVTLLLFNSDSCICLATTEIRQTGMFTLLEFNSDRQVHVPCYSSTQTDRYMYLATVHSGRYICLAIVQFRYSPCSCSTQKGTHSPCCCCDEQTGIFTLLLFNSDRQVHIHLAAVEMNRQLYSPCYC